MEKKRGESDSDTLSTCESTTTGLLWSRSSWLTAVGEELGVGGWEGWSAHWERRIEGEEEERGRGEIEDVSSHAFIRNVSRGTFPFPIHGTVLCVITGFGKL